MTPPHSNLEQTLDSATASAAGPFRAPADFPPPGADSLPPAALAERARASMEAEWARGNRVPAEWYLDHAPTLGRDPSAALDVVFLEFVLREDAGEEPTAAAFADRFPALGPDLRRLIGLDSALAPPDATSTVDPDEPAAAAPSRFIGRYFVLEELRGGGQADVFIGVHPGLGREVVIKRLRGGARGGAEAASLLAAESRVLASLDHPHLAKVYDLDVVDGRPFMVMESIRGRNLADARRHAAVSPADAAKWVAAVARATDHAHARGVLHLDIKPRNVVLDDTGRAVLIDFGLARVDRGLDPPGPEAGVSGTLAYMAPEQARAEHDRIGPPADVYGLGGVLYYLLVGKDPVPGGSMSEVYERARMGEWDRAGLRACGAPPRLIAVCERALNEDPANRYPSAVAFAEAVEAAVRPRRWPVVVGALAAAGLLVGIAVVAWPGHSPGPQPTPPPVTPPATKPDLRFTMRVFGPGRLHGPPNPSPPYTIGERVQFQAGIPAGWHAALILATEAGKVQVLATFDPEPKDRDVVYPVDEKGKPDQLKLIPPPGTHVVLLAVSPAGPITPEQLGLREGETWAALPAQVLIAVGKGHADITEGHRDFGPAKAVKDPAGEVQARLNRLLHEAPANVTVEGVAFAVKPR